MAEQQLVGADAFNVVKYEEDDDAETDLRKGKKKGTVALITVSPIGHR